MITKKFKYRSQMNNYYNKVKNNPKIKFHASGWFYDDNGHGFYGVMYSYKKINF